MRSYESSSNITATVAGSTGYYGSVDGRGAKARFIAPFGLVIDDQKNLYVTDVASKCIRKITNAGDVSTLACANPDYVPVKANVTALDR